MSTRSHCGSFSADSLGSVPLRWVLTLTALLSTALSHQPALAQESDDIPTVTRAFAVRNARIVQAPGQVIERGTVVLEDGLITAVGTNVEIPYDADVIEGDSLTVYAGFIDGLSHVGIPQDDEETPDRREPVNRADPPDELAGIQPQRKARELLDPSEKSVDDLRRLGFTAAHVVPRGRMLPGSGSLILLEGEEPADMVLRPDVSMFMQFEGGRGVYPATTMGVMATLRQLVRESRRRRQVAIAYAQNPAGMDRPAFDPVHEAFYPVLSHEKPIYVLADGEDSAVEVHRALNLREELDFSLALAGLAQGFDVADDLQGAGVPLFVTLDLPDLAKESSADSAATDTTKAVTPEEPATFFVSDLRTHSFEDVGREKTNLDARQALERERYYGTAARLHDAGLRFGVTTLGAESSNIRRNVRRMIDAGLSEEDALAALTIDGARLLGLERSLGTVEPGKMANLVITKGSYFDVDSPVHYVFVDGRKYDYTSKPAAASLAPVAGVWQLRIDTPDGIVRAELTLRGSGGEITSDELSAPSEVEDVEFDGELLSFSFDTAEYGRITVELTISGSSLSGTIDVPQEGTFDVTGTRPE